MERMVVVLEWDDEQLGKKWMNIDNLKACLFGDTRTRSDLVRVKEVTEEVQMAINNIGVPGEGYPANIDFAYGILYGILGEEA